MQIVYGTHDTRFLKFYLTDKREAVPPGATVFAICVGSRTIENQDEETFSAMTGEELSTLRSMINEASRLESALAANPKTTTCPSIRLPAAQAHAQ